jgi:hypothetical protein
MPRMVSQRDFAPARNLRAPSLPSHAPHGSPPVQPLATLRAELAAQFAGHYEQLRFHHELLIVDEAQQMAAVSWRCEHGLDNTLALPPLRILQRALSQAACRQPWGE